MFSFVRFALFIQIKCKIKISQLNLSLQLIKTVHTVSSLLYSCVLSAEREVFSVFSSSSGINQDSGVNMLNSWLGTKRADDAICCLQSVTNTYTFTVLSRCTKHIRNWTSGRSVSLSSHSILLLYFASVRSE